RSSPRSTPILFAYRPCRTPRLESPFPPYRNGTPRKGLVMRTCRGHPRRTRSWGSLLAITWLVSWLAACSPTPAITVGTEVGSVEVVRGTSADLTVTLTRSGGATADVQLSVAGLPANVDATF